MAQTPTPRPRSGDVLAGPADYTRPQNPWPRLLAFGVFVVAMLGLGGLCVASFANTPDRGIRVRNTEYQPGVPKFIAVPTFGADQERRTYGAFLAIATPGGPARAFFSRSTDSACNLQWEAGTTFEGVTGVFVDPCSGARFGFDGVALHEGATRNLHEFGARRETNSYVVSFEVLTLGGCLEGHVAEDGACSPPGATETREVPSGELPGDFGYR